MLKLLKPGDEIISTNDLYGGSYRLFTKIFEDYGLVFHFTEMQNLSSVENLINNKTKLIWVETPTNPMMNIIDINGLSLIAKKFNILLGVDNTFATPFLQQPLSLGADIVMHSATKYLAGHSDVVLGALIVNNEQLSEKLYFIQNASGAICGPMDSFLTLRGIKTLHVRMKRHCENAEKIAKYLSSHAEIENVYWPGFKSHANHNIAVQQMNDFGAMISFTTKGNNFKKSIKFLHALLIAKFTQNTPKMAPKRVQKSPGNSLKALPEAAKNAPEATKTPNDAPGPKMMQK